MNSETLRAGGVRGLDTSNATGPAKPNRLSKMSAWRSSLSSQRLKLRIGKCLATTLAVTIACAVSGCSCPIGKAQSEPLTPIESIPDHGDTGSVGSVGPAKKALELAAVDPELLKRAKPPSCELTGGAKPSPGTPGANADPNLLEIARLQLVNECYKLAERTVRKRLERLQNAFADRLRS
jgi:hypothetical protein